MWPNSVNLPDLAQKCCDSSVFMQQKCLSVGSCIMQSVKCFFFLFSLNLDKQTAKGSTALHYCCLTDNSECLKLLLRGKASIDIGKFSMLNLFRKSHFLITRFPHREQTILAFSLTTLMFVL